MMNPRWAGWLVVLGAGLFLAMLVVEYLSTLWLHSMPVSLHSFPAIVNQWVHGSWLFATPLVAIIGSLLTATYSGAIAPKDIPGGIRSIPYKILNAYLSYIETTGGHWLAIAALAVALSAAFRGILMWMGL